MTLKALSNLVHKFYSNGTIKSTDIQLTQSAIQGYLSTAYVAVIQNIIDKKKKGNELDYSHLISGAIKLKTVDVTKKGNYKFISLEGLNVMRLENFMQIIGFSHPGDDCGCGNNSPQLENITPVQPDEVSFYRGAEYGDLLFYSLLGNNIALYNIPDCLTKVELQYVSEDADIDIPGDVCLQICKIAFPDVFGVKKFDKPKVDDNSNQMIEQLKLQIAANATV